MGQVMSNVLEGHEVIERLKEGPVLCWVTKSHRVKSIIRLVTKCFDDRFYADDTDIYYFARLLSADDKRHFLRD